MHRLSIIAQCAQEHFSDILGEAPIIFSDKVREEGKGNIYL
jgi:hypothetical protein